MSKPTDTQPAPPQEEPRILIAGQWIPAHLAWERLNTASEVADTIARFNERFPDLSTSVTREVVPRVRQRLREIELRMPKRPKTPDLAALARDLLARHTPEDALEALAETEGEHLNLNELIALAGEQAYLKSLRREAQEYAANAILPEQTAVIWNDMKRPAPGGGLWSQRKVEMILQLPAAD